MNLPTSNLFSYGTIISKSYPTQCICLYQPFFGNHLFIPDKWALKRSGHPKRNCGRTGSSLLGYLQGFCAVWTSRLWRVHSLIFLISVIPADAPCSMSESSRESDCCLLSLVIFVHGKLLVAGVLTTDLGS